MIVHDRTRLIGRLLLIPPVRGKIGPKAYLFLPVLSGAARSPRSGTRHMTHQDPVCQRLMTTPGVGFVTTLTFKAAVDDPTRFKRSRTVAAHFGLTPRRFQSGEMDNPGHISRAGDPEVRCTLYVAANAMMTRSSAAVNGLGMKS